MESTDPLHISALCLGEEAYRLLPATLATCDQLARLLVVDIRLLEGVGADGSMIDEVRIGGGWRRGRELRKNDEDAGFLEGTTPAGTTERTGRRRKFGPGGAVDAD